MKERSFLSKSFVESDEKKEAKSWGQTLKTKRYIIRMRRGWEIEA